MGKLLEELHPVALKKAVEAVAILKDKGIKFAITSTRRTMYEQIALYAQGRRPLVTVNELRDRAKMRRITEAENAYTVTNCDGVKVLSRHQGGKAIDIVPATDRGNPIWPPPSDARWEEIAAVMKGCGFAWGGDWPQFPDYPHYEIV